MKKRILLVAGNYPPNIVGGGEISTQILAEALASAGAIVHVLTIGTIEGVTTQSGVTIQTCLSPNIYWRFAKPNRPMHEKMAWHALDNWNPRAIRLFATAIKQFRPDVMITSVLENFGTAAWIAARRLGVPAIDIIHGYYLQCVQGSRFWRGRNCEARCVTCKLSTLGKQYYSGYVDEVIGVSSYVLGSHRSEGYFRRAKAVTIFNPIANPVARSRTAYRAQRATFGYLGKLLPTKGIEALVRVFSGGGINGQLVVAGNGDPSFEARLRATANPTFVKFLGWVDPDELFNQIEFLVFPSLWNEPFGRGVAEAMTNGIPVIGARRGGIPELIEHGVDGFLFEPDLEDQLTETIVAALEADYAGLSRNALRRATRYSFHTIATQVLDFVDTVVECAPLEDGQRAASTPRAV